VSSHNQRRLERLEALVGEPAGQHSTAEHEKIRGALDRVVLLRRRQGVAADDLSLKSDEDRQAWAIFDAGRKQAERGRGKLWRFALVLKPMVVAVEHKLCVTLSGA
jgi:hypothetical protein